MKYFAGEYDVAVIGAGHAGIEAALAAAVAKMDSLQATLNDTSLKAPISGRVLYRLAEPGEVLAAGGKALTLLDLSDMYMTIYLPTDKAGRVALGSDARIVLDALPGQAIPASVVFVAAKAQGNVFVQQALHGRIHLVFLALFLWGQGKGDELRGQGGHGQGKGRFFVTQGVARAGVFEFGNGHYNTGAHRLLAGSL